MPDTQPSIVAEQNFYPPWAPRVWSGMRIPEIWRLLNDCRFKIHWSRYPMTFMVSCTSLVNSGFSLVQKLAFDSKVRGTAIEQPPIFIVGHWRSGTTLTHELLSRDTRLSFPDNYEAFVPWHFLVSAGLLRWPIRLLLPSRRPFDNMNFDVDYPQEDDFALMAMGAVTYYRRFGFPDLQDDFVKLLDSEKLETNERQYLAHCIEYFFKALTYRSSKQLVLKSPPHTARIRLLLELFPNAKFIHISRHPYKVVPSTLRLWAINDRVHGFHPPGYGDQQLMQHVAETQSAMYEAYFRDRSLLADDQLVEISFESLIADPQQTIEKVYGQLQLEGVKGVVESTRDYFEQRRGHRQNKHSSDHLRQQIDVDWAEYMQRFGY